MILHSKQLIFFHIPKVAGTSIEIAIYGKKWDPYSFDRELFLGWHDAYGFTQHAVYSQMLDFYDEHILSGYFKFCFVRNPWERVLSAFRYITPAKEQTLDNFIAFVEKYHDLVSTNSYTPGHHATPQSDYIFHDGIQIVDFIGRYERLHEVWLFIS